jgi:hypothetical protein
MRINSVPDVKCFCNNEKCYVYNQWYYISYATLYVIEYNQFNPLAHEFDVANAYKLAETFSWSREVVRLVTRLRARKPIIPS